MACFPSTCLHVTWVGDHSLTAYISVCTMHQWSRRSAISSKCVQWTHWPRRIEPLYLESLTRYGCKQGLRDGWIPFSHSSSSLAPRIQAYSKVWFLWHVRSVASFIFFSLFLCCDEQIANSLTLWPCDFLTLWPSNTLTESASLLPITAGLQWIAKSHPANRKFQSSHLERHFRLEYNDWTVRVPFKVYNSIFCIFSLVFFMIEKACNNDLARKNNNAWLK